MSAKKNLLNYFLANIGKEIDRDTLREVASVHEWQRVVRTLRQEGWDIMATQKGYVLNSELQNEKGNKRQGINAKLRYQVLQRDSSKCRRCGKTIDDGIKLEVDHKIPVEWGGTNDVDNLWTLCNECNGGKKHFFSDFDQEVMSIVLQQESGYRRLLKFFELTPNIVIEPSKIDVVTGIRDWERTLRFIRKKEQMDIQWVAKSKEYPNGGYIFIK